MKSEKQEPNEKQMNNIQLRQLLRDYKQQKTQFVVDAVASQFSLPPSVISSIPESYANKDDDDGIAMSE
jgi:hypothetical protein